MKTLFLNFRCADRMCIPVLRNITEVSFALSNMHSTAFFQYNISQFHILVPILGSFGKNGRLYGRLLWYTYKMKKAESIKYYVTYSITHPEYTPTTATGLVEARTRLDLDGRLARGIGMWKKRGYGVEIVKVTCMDDFQWAAQD